ncbi:hypothetical protein PABG_07294 [Paracoccidioides brasiliensis Pb03]|uniref:ER membrane protein complex subunit 7 beta-sandwich domain-containing protein n=1 Tax=Paracoccidioides brasiliensis (strain Pb18) TaxID=502780 RepID=C1GLX3_PARBD|nr:uncharacterized protein PADG_08364 [Paracoccidioides brasiliensis Pb18]EEH17207.1 hypothetical protein PABG_07294 [Paracoccidioides brasiliensis Pb03]EEH43439.1 hypothetical protein PADG_08364 [Paracoccidioides brasiliensis Pb18]ODH46446.1 hypothetical protein GX48_07465 [Paracoccidioides brasiliensis]
MRPPRSPHLKPLCLLTLLALLTTTASASLLIITIPPSLLLPNPNSLPASTHATLTTLLAPTDPDANPTQTLLLKAPLTRKSTFVFDNPRGKGPQSFLLDIRSRDYVFVPYRVDVDGEGGVVGVWETYRGNAWENRGPEKVVIRDVDVAIVEAKVVGVRGFYEERAKFSPLSLFKNPMILLVGFALAVTIGMPYLMERMDPETRAEFERHSRKSALTGAANGAGAGAAPGAAGFDLAGWMAGTSQGPMAALDSTVRAGAGASASGRESGAAERRRR